VIKVVAPVVAVTDWKPLRTFAAGVAPVVTATVVGVAEV
jgi:hypothetical protein